MKERWEKIRGHGDCYSVSNLGNVMRTSPREIWWRKSTPNFKPSPIRAYINKGGYFQVRIGPTGKQRTVSVHKLVAMAFASNPHNYREVNHMDGVKTNNRADNLEWVSRSANLKHAVETGLLTIPSGEQHGNSKLTAEQVVAIRADPRVARLVAKDYGIHLSNVYLIRNRKAWAHIP